MVLTAPRVERLGRHQQGAADRTRGRRAHGARGHQAVATAKANGSWTILDNAEAGVEPDDLAAALDQDAAARANWDAFPPSSRKLGIATVDAARRPETRAARIAKIVGDAAAGKRP